MAAFVLTTGDDTFTGGSGDDIFTAPSAATLNPGDQLDGGAGYDTLSIGGAGTFDLNALAKFANIEEVDYGNGSGTSGTLTLRDSTNIKVNAIAAGGTNNRINLGSGTATLMLQNSGFTVYGSSGAAIINSVGGSNIFHLGAGSTTLTSGGGTVYLGSGAASLNLSGGHAVTGGDGTATINVMQLGVLNFTGSTGHTTIDMLGTSGTFQLGSGTTDITLEPTGFYSNGPYNISIGSGATQLVVYTNSNVHVDVSIDHLNNNIFFGQTYHNQIIALSGPGAVDIAPGVINWRWDLSLGANETVGITSAIAASLESIFNNSGSNDVVRTADTALDLRTTSLSNVSVTSTNAFGTTFTVANASTALAILGGPGDDTVYAPTTTFTSLERSTIFLQGSIETITDKSGTYHNPAVPVYQFHAPVLATSQYGAGAAGGGWTSQNLYPRLAADVNGDGRADIVAFGEYGVSVSLGQAGGSFGAMQSDIRAFGHDPSSGGLTNNDIYPRFLADVNGDGLADIVGAGDGGVFVSLATGGGHFANPFLGVAQFGVSAGAGGWTNQTLYARQLGDVNGDGMADMVGFGSHGVYVSLATGGGHFGAVNFELDKFGSDPSGGNFTSNDTYPRYVADVNGDGMDDIVGFGDAGVYVSLATGGGHFAQPLLAIQQFGHDAAAGGWSSNNLYPRVVGDINGDGRADIVGFAEYGLYYALGQANGTFGPITADRQIFGHDPSHGGLSNNDMYPRQLADVNGDGHADIIATGDNGLYVSTAGDFLFT